MEMAAAVTLETGKSRAESIAEVAGGDRPDRDLLRADRGARRLRGPARHARAARRRNRSVLRPFGVFGVIGPFNFPVALVTGMSAGALVAGNTVVLKPSEHAPLSGALVGEAFAAAGLPGGRRERRARRRRRPASALAEGAIDGVVFTGSAEVGRGARAGASRTGAYAPPGDHRDGRQEPGDRGRRGRPRRRRRGHRRLRVRLLGPEVQRLLARDRASTPSTTSSSSGSRRGRRSSPSATRPTRDAFTGPVIDERAVARFDARGRRGRARRRGRRRRRRALDLPRPLRRADGRQRTCPPGHRAHARGAVRPVRDRDARRLVRRGAGRGERHRLRPDRRRLQPRRGRGRRASSTRSRPASSTSTAARARLPARGRASSRSAAGRAAARPARAGSGPYYVQQFMREQSRTVVSE